MSDFRSITEVLNHVEKMVIIDLIPHVLLLNERPNLLDALKPPTQGVYVVGSIEPIVRSDGWYFANVPGTIERLPIQVPINVANLSALKADITDERGKMVLQAKDLITNARFFRDEPSVPVTALKAAIATVEQYLFAVSRHNRRMHPTYALEYLIKQEHIQPTFDVDMRGNETGQPTIEDVVRNPTILDTDEYMHAFEHLLDQVTDFVDGKHWNFYFTKVKGTSLILEQGIDYRIYKYYQAEFDKKAKEEADAFSD